MLTAVPIDFQDLRLLLGDVKLMINMRLCDSANALPK